MSTSLTTTDAKNYAIVQSGNVADLLADVLSPGETLSFGDLPRVKVPAGGSMNWELPSGDATKELACVVIHRQIVRAYWNQSFDETGGGTPPDCSSLDNVHGEGLFGVMNGIPANGNPTGECAKCPMNQWESATNAKGENTKGKACRQITRLFVMFPDSVLPTVVSLPPSSLKEAQKYVVNLAAMGQAYYGVVTGISLTKAQSEGGVAYSQAVFRKLADVDAETGAKLKAYRESMVPALTGLRVEEGV